MYVNVISTVWSGNKSFLQEQLDKNDLIQIVNKYCIMLSNICVLFLSVVRKKRWWVIGKNKTNNNDILWIYTFEIVFDIIIYYIFEKGNALKQLLKINLKLMTNFN